MKFGCSLEMVNMLTSGPNFIYKQSKSFWVNYFKYIAAVGFKAVELPFNPFSSDPMAFETGRCGIPCNSVSINSKYGGYDTFLSFLNDLGIEEVCDVHASANDAMLEVAASGIDKEKYFEYLQKQLDEALIHTKALKSSGLVFSPTPEIGWIDRLFGETVHEEFADRTIAILQDAAKKAHEMELTFALKTEYWSLFRGKAMAELLKSVDGAAICPDLAHMAIAGDPVSIVVEAHKDQIQYMHLSDTSFSDDYENYRKINAEIPVDGPQKVFCDLGEGKVELLKSVRILADNGYDGWIICEQKKTLDVYRGLLKLGWFVNHEIINKLDQEER